MFLQFSTAEHISKVNCAEITRGRPGQPAYEIFQHRTYIFNRLSFDLLESRLSDFPHGKTDAVARHVSFAQITCFFAYRTKH